MTDLDRPASFAAVDPDDALGDVEGAAAQWRAAAELDVPALPLDVVDAVVVAGMGGSGMAGDVAVSLARRRSDVPIFVHRGYGLPAWAGAATLVVGVSYSGGTEETLSAVEDGVARGCPCAVVASGGPLGELADARGLPWIVVPPGGMPRHSLGWLAVPLLKALELDDGLDEALEVLAAGAQRWGRDVPLAENAAKQLGARIAASQGVALYGDDGLSGVAARRLRAQLNENAKLPARDAAMPEGCHNEVMAWEGAPPRRDGVVWLRDGGGEHPGIGRRVEVLRGLLDPVAAWQAEVHSSGTAALARLASLLVQVDLVSVYAALALDRDPTPIASIRALKAALAATT